MSDIDIEEIQNIWNSPYLNCTQTVNNETCTIYKHSSLDEIINYINFVKKHNIYDSESLFCNLTLFFNQEEIKCNDFQVVFSPNKMPRILFKSSKYNYNSCNHLCCYDKILKVIFLDESNFSIVEKLKDLSFTEFMQYNEQDLDYHKRNCSQLHKRLTILNQRFKIINGNWYFVTEFSLLATEFVRCHYRDETITDKKMKHLENGKTKINYEEAFKTAMCREMFSVCLKDIATLGHIDST